MLRAIRFSAGASDAIGTTLLPTIVVASVALFVAGIAKMPEFLDAHYSRGLSWGDFMWAFLAVGEMSIAAMALANPRSRLLHRTIAVVFLAFAVYSTSKFLSNRDCDCLGALNASVRNIAIVDWTVVTFLVVGLVASKRKTARRESAFPKLVSPAIQAVAIAVCFVSVSHFAFRSARADLLGAANIRVGEFFPHPDSEGSAIISGDVKFANPSDEPMELLLVEGKCAVARVKHDAVQIEPRSCIDVAMISRKPVVDAGTVPFRVYVKIRGNIKNHFVVSNVNRSGS